MKVLPRIRNSLIVLLMIFLLGLVLNPNRMPIVDLINLHSWDPPLLVVRIPAGSITRNLTAVTPCDFFGTPDLGLIGDKFLINLGLSRMMDIPYTASENLAICDLSGRILRLINPPPKQRGYWPLYLAYNSTISANCTRIVWNQDDMWLTCLLPDGSYEQIPLDSETIISYSMTDVLLSDDGNCVLFITSTRGFSPYQRSFDLYWYNFSTGEKRELQSIRSPMYGEWARAYNILNDWPHLICDISPDGSEVVVIGGEENGDECGINFWSPDSGEVVWGESEVNPFRWDYCPAFSPNGEGIYFLRYSGELDETPSIDLLYRGRYSEDVSVILSDIGLKTKDAHTEGLVFPSDYFLLESGVSRNPEILIISRNLDPANTEGPDSNIRHFNLGTLNGIPPRFDFDCSSKVPFNFGPGYQAGPLRLTWGQMDPYDIEEGEYTQRIHIRSSELGVEFRRAYVVGSSGL